MTSRRSTPSSLSSISTDSYPKLYKSFSTNRSESDSSTTSSDSSSRPSSSSSESASTVPNHPEQESSPSTLPPRLKWDREEPTTAGRRPYDSRQFEVSFKPLPGYLSDLGGLGIPSRKPCDPVKPDPFHRRTHVDEIFHKRVTDSTKFSISERPKLNVCLQGTSVKSIGKILDSVLLADNVNSDREESSGESDDDDEEEALSEISCREFQQQRRPPKDDVLRECKRSFFQARKELFKLRQHDEYLEKKNRVPEEVESWEISSDDSFVETDVELEPKPEVQIVKPSEKLTDEYQLPEIVREECKERVQEHERSYLGKVQQQMWRNFEEEENAQREAQALRELSPEPLEEEEIIRNVPQQDYLNEQKQLHREALAKRLEEIQQSQKRTPKNLSQTTAQFEKYTDALMSARRELRDEAILVDDHYRKAGLDLPIPEKDLQLRKFRAADFKSDDEEESEKEDNEGDTSSVLEEPSVHTCMTRFEWAHWISRCTKLEKLTFPKVKIPRLPKEIHKAEQSPIRMYLKGLHEEDKASLVKEQKTKAGGGLTYVRKPRKVAWHLSEMLYDKPVEFRISEFIPYKPPIRPFPELAKESFRRNQAARRRRRDRRKRHMNWIEDLVEGICAKKLH